MKDYRFKIFASLVLLWIGNSFGIDVQIYLGVFLILTVGVFHGANDLFLLENENKLKTSGVFTKKKYIVLLGLNCALFLIFPKMAFISFVLFSIYHFGEQHFENSFSNNRYLLNYLTILSFGSLFFGTIFHFNNVQVIQIVSEISGFNITSNAIALFWKASLIIYGFSFLAKSITDLVFRAQVWNEVFSLLLLYVIIVNGSLIWAFTIYFIIWHAMPSINTQIGSFSKTIDKKAILKYLSNGLLNWIISIVALFVLLFFLHETKVVFTILFSFLAAITMPHVVLMKFFLDKSDVK
jgi:beta-carotene 15,15'-dioxygenase